jgi:hypothetical protein
MHQSRFPIIFRIVRLVIVFGTTFGIAATRTRSPQSQILRSNIHDHPSKESSNSSGKFQHTNTITPKRTRKQTVATLPALLIHTGTTETNKSRLQIPTLTPCTRSTPNSAINKPLSVLYASSGKSVSTSPPATSLPPPHPVLLSDPSPASAHPARSMTRWLPSACRSPWSSYVPPPSPSQIPSDTVDTAWSSPKLELTSSN